MNNTTLDEMLVLVKTKGTQEEKEKTGFELWCICQDIGCRNSHDVEKDSVKKKHHKRAGERQGPRILQLVCADGKIIPNR